MAVEAGLLGQVAEPAAERQPLVGPGRVAAEQPQPARVGAEDGGGDPQEGRLAGAVRAEQAGHAGAGAERHAGQGPERSEGLGQRRRSARWRWSCGAPDLEGVAPEGDDDDGGNGEDGQAQLPGRAEGDEALDHRPAR